MDLKNIELEYHQKELNISQLDKDPVHQFNTWMKEVLSLNISYPNAVTLTTIGEDGFPQARIVLIKEINHQGVIFFTNYDSDKGQEILNHNKVGINFFWKELDRQVRICGRATKVSAHESEQYFRSRKRDSQISAIASPQSKEVNKAELLKKVEEIDKKYPNSKDLPMPKNWGGYVINPESFEFWQGRPNRLHDRFKYNKDGLGWKITQLGP